MKKSIVILFLLIASFGFAQKQNANNLALQYYGNKEFDKAVSIYQQLFEQTKSRYYFKYYINCLVELKDFKTAEKAINAQIRRNSGDYSYKVQLGNIYEIQGNTAKAESIYQNSIKKIKYNRQQIILLANEFIRLRKYDYAEQTYKIGIKKAKDNYKFNFELATVYQLKNEPQLMIDQYLAVLEDKPSFLKSVQNRMQYTVYKNDDGTVKDLLKRSLLIKIQQRNSGIVFNELLIWLFLQDKDFKNALTQVKSLDKRLKENGKRVFNLGELALSNNDYSTAINAYSYLINKGEENHYYILSNNKILQTKFKKILSDNYTDQDLLDLKIEYIASVNKLGKSLETFTLITDLAKLKAFYLGEINQGLNDFTQVLKTPNLTPRQVAETKTNLGDIYLLLGNFWDSALYYAQVESSFKNNPLGYTAKYKKAKLAFYTGDFKWAQAQLDVLKASTSKLIANNAFELSQLINDNSALDTSLTALEMYSRADLLLYQNKDTLALIVLDSIINEFPSHSLNDEILFLKAKISIKRRDYKNAEELLIVLSEKYSYDILADNALFMLAEIYEQNLNLPEKAVETYKKLMLKHTGSIFISDARKRYNSLNSTKEINFFYNIKSK